MGVVGRRLSMVLEKVWGEGQVGKGIDKTFETREECEGDAKAHGMDGDFFKLL